MNPPQHNVSQTETVLQPLQQKIVIDAVERCGEVQEAEQSNLSSICSIQHYQTTHAAKPFRLNVSSDKRTGNAA